MRSLPGALCVLSAVVATGYSLYCTSCSNLQKATCTGNKIICPSGRVCGSQFSVNKRGMPTFEWIKRTCVPLNRCNSTESYKTLYGEVYRGTSCCTGDNCDPDIPTAPASSTEFNGVTCSSCFANDNGMCGQDKRTMSCTGDERNCFSLDLYDGAAPKNIYWGCGTSGVCSIGRENVINKGKTYTYKFNCTEPVRQFLRQVFRCTTTITTALFPITATTPAFTTIPTTTTTQTTQILTPDPVEDTTAAPLAHPADSSDTRPVAPIEDASNSDPLSCIECVNATGSSCTGSSLICPAGNVCGSQYTVTESCGVISEMVSRKCLPVNQCSSSGSYRFNNVKVKEATSCCNTNDCNPSLPQWPSSSAVPNGLTCPTCSSLGAIFCYSGEAMQCTGNENVCFMRSSTITESKQPLSVRGCATSNICKSEFQSAAPGVPYTNVRFYCIDFDPDEDEF